MGVSRI